jgi:hypothetical protein
MGVVYLTIAAGVAHAIAGAIVGPSLINRARTPSYQIAALRGAGISLLALAFFSVAFSGYLLRADGWTVTLAAIIAMPLYTAFFAFFALGWALLVTSAIVASGIHKLIA